MSETPNAATETKIPTRPITVAEYYRMGEIGIIKPDEPIELLDGELMLMPPVGPEHDYVVNRLGQCFIHRFAGRAFVRYYGGLRLDRLSEPLSDLMLVELPKERYAKMHPTPAQVLLVVEVAQSSLSYDRGKKLHAYAR